MSMLLMLSSFVAALAVALAVAFELAIARTGTVRPKSESDVAEMSTKLSVVIPARNEEQDIERSLRSVLSQRGVELQIIVVNDNSTDRTGEIVHQMADSDVRITVVDNPELKAGWLGKPNAMQRGVMEASHDLILFCDADIIHSPTCFATGISQLEVNDLDFVSFMPKIECESFWENVFIPLSLFPMMAQFALAGPNDPKSSSACAAGAFMLIRRTTLHEIGGLESIKFEIMDDLELARVVKRNGHRVGYYLGPDLLRVRIFKSNHHAFWGPTKNAIALSFSNPWMSLPTMLLPVLVFWMPLVATGVGLAAGDIRLFSIGLLQPVISVLCLARIRFLCEFKWHKAILFSLIAIPMVCVLARSFYEQTIRGTLNWRGRAINLHH